MESFGSKEITIVSHKSSYHKKSLGKTGGDKNERAREQMNKYKLVFDLRSTPNRVFLTHLLNFSTLSYYLLMNWNQHQC